MTLAPLKNALQKPSTLGFLLVLALSYFTYFQGYWNPPSVFWDENYHIASAQKYLNGVYFMEQHPPLGKLLIALGEKIVDANPIDNEFINTDYATNFRPEFSFAGYRFFPALLAWLTAPLLYLIFILITGSPLAAALLCFLYIFDNALIVHLRGAMLESTMLFTMAASILFFLLMLKYRDRRDAFTISCLWFGIALALVATTKLLGLVLLLLIPAAMLRFWPDTRAMVKFLGFGICGFLLAYVAVWQTHFALERTVLPGLPDQGYYQASPAYKVILTEGRTRSLRAFLVMLQDSLKFIGHYSRGVPRLDLCKANENGSPFYFWPMGGRSINYRWETPNGQSHRYLYLQVNPVVWWSGFAGVLIALALIATSWIGPVRFSFKQPFLLYLFTGLYVAYMIAISRIDRVMYLYHYFIPLFFTFLILGVLSQEILRVGRWTINEKLRRSALLAFALLIFAGFEFYRPLTYYEPLNKQQFERRAFFPLWELTCVNCQQKSGLVSPRP